MEQPWNRQQYPCCDEQEEHKESHCAAYHDACQSETAFVHWYEAYEAALLVRCSVGNTYAKQHHLLYDEHQNAWQYEVAIATCIVEYWHIGYQHRLCCKLVVAVGVVARQRYLYVRVHIGSHSCAGLEYSLIGKHQSHVAIHADMGLLHASEVMVEVLRQKYYAVHFLLAHESACLLKVVAVGCYTNVGRCIYVAN